MVEVYDIEELLYRLYDCLPTEYSITVVVLKSNKKKNENKTLRILQEIKDTLRDHHETDMYARRSSNSRQRSASQSITSKINRSPLSRSTNRFPKPQHDRTSLRKLRRCFIYNNENHLFQECDAFKKIKKIIRVLKNKKAVKKKVSFVRDLNFKKKRSQKAYEAKSNISDTSTNENEEIAHIIQKVISKLEPFT